VFLARADGVECRGGPALKFRFVSEPSGPLAAASARRNMLAMLIML